MIYHGKCKDCEYQRCYGYKMDYWKSSPVIILLGKQKYANGFIFHRPSQRCSRQAGLNLRALRAVMDNLIALLFYIITKKQKQWYMVTCLLHPLPDIWSSSN